MAFSSSNRAFGILISIILFLYGAKAFFYTNTFSYWAFGLAGIFIAIAIIIPSLLSLPNKLWLGLGNLLHSVVSPVILGFIFYFVITPIGLIMQFWRSKTIHKKFDKNVDTYWVERTPRGPSPNSMLDQF